MTLSDLALRVPVIQAPMAGVATPLLAVAGVAAVKRAWHGGNRSQLK